MTTPVNQAQSPLDVYVDRVRQRAREPYQGNTVGCNRLCQLNNLADAELAALHGDGSSEPGPQTWADYSVYLAPLRAVKGDELDAQLRESLHDVDPDHSYDLSALNTMSEDELNNLAFVVAALVHRYAVLTVQREEAAAGKDS